MTCSIPGCGKPAKSRGWCQGHYKKWRRYGDPLARSSIFSPPMERLLARREITESGCWVTGAKGYAKLNVDGKRVHTHRFSYEHFVGPIPEGLHIDHLCREPRCFNPAHLEPVTNKENNLRGTSPAATNARKTHCVHGHSLADAYVDRAGDRIGRKCRTCTLERVRARHARLRAAHK